MDVTRPARRACGAAPGPDAAPRAVRELRFDLDERPFLVFVELTRACALACRHCRAEAVADPDPDELGTAEIAAVLDDLGSLGSPRPHVIFTGGDPLRRADLEELVARAAENHLAVGVSPAGTPLASARRLGRLRAAGASVVSLSLDGATAESHDAFRRVSGSFAWTLDACAAARASGLRLQVNTTVCRETVLELPALARRVHGLGANLWSLFFLVPVGRARAMGALSASETEDVLAFVAQLSALLPVKTTEAPAYRRVVQQAAHERTSELARRLWARLHTDWPEAAAQIGSGAPAPARRRAPLAVGDGRGVVFVSRTGLVQPSGFLPLVAGSVRAAPLSSIYRHSPLLRSLRDPAALGGRCRSCPYAAVCGGSRSMAYARSGDPLAEDPSCPYDPAGGPPPTSLSA